MTVSFHLTLCILQLEHGIYSNNIMIACFCGVGLIFIIQGPGIKRSFIFEAASKVMKKV